MPNLSSFTPSKSSPLKLLVLGDSGTGKTGALVSLIRAGYNVRVLDADRGMDILWNLLKDEPEAVRARLTWEEVIDEKTVNAAGLVTYKGTPSGFSRAMKLLNGWKTEDYDLGPITSWTLNDVLVIDSLTFLSTSAMAGVLALAGRLPPAHPQIQDWGAAMDRIENLLGLLFSPAVPCHVIINSHLTYIQPEGEGEGVVRAYPSTLGTKLPPKVGRFFNTMLLAKSEGSGAGLRRKIFTVPTNALALKTPDPARTKASYDLNTGLADIFKDLGYQPSPK